MSPCKICGHAEGNLLFPVREMMFGFRDEFSYLECAACGCVQLQNPPADLAKYYPDDYYSLQAPDERRLLGATPLKRAKRSVRGLLLNRFLASEQPGGRTGRWFSESTEWLRGIGINRRSRILDVGCGAGERLLRLRNDGFLHLGGVDPFVRGEIHYRCGIVIHRSTLAEHAGTYDVIMLHHAFEHMDQPLQMMRELHRHLNPAGHVLIRIPLADSFAFRKYRANWVQLDAPRHFFLHTRKSMASLAASSGFSVRKVVCDSGAFQFSGSEQYLRDVPLKAKHDLFSAADGEKFAADSEKLNAAGEGDQAGFFLTKA
jgi:SAM-dependent methyltransferase